MMNSDSQQPASPQTPGDGAHDSLRQIRHDLRHALYVLDLALTLLEESRTDEARFSEVLQMLRKEQTTVNVLVARLLDSVRQTKAE